MPSPFPGMDPYLEAPDLWAGVHARLIAVLGELLANQVAPRFFVDVEETVYILSPDDPGRHVIRPDLSIGERVLAPAGRHDTGRISQPRVLERPRPIDVRARQLVILDRRNRHVVTTIQVLSPVNKIAGSAGRDDFMRKREQVIQSDTHWLEIDLLRAGVRPMEVAHGGDYYALLHRAQGGDRLEAWFAGLRDPLPIIAVPLVDDLPDAPLDLQAAVTAVYTRNHYDIGVDYRQSPPPPPLNADDAAWAAERIAVWQREREAEARQA